MGWRVRWIGGNAALLTHTLKESSEQGRGTAFLIQCAVPVFPTTCASDCSLSCGCLQKVAEAHLTAFGVLVVYRPLLSVQVGSGSISGDSLQDHLQRESLERYLTSRIQGVGPKRAKQLVGLHGAGIVQQLDGDAEAALKALTQIRGVGCKTAEQMLRSWAQNAIRGGSSGSCLIVSSLSSI